MRRSLLYLTSIGLAASTFAYTQPVIFFRGGNAHELDPQQWQITPEANAVLSRVVEEYRYYKDQYLLIIGHDEDASTPELSYERSKKRAEATRLALIDLGLPRDRLAIKACSFDQPYEATKGSNPMNRRVEFAGAPSLQVLLEVDREICPNTHAPKKQAGSAARQQRR